MKWVTDFTAAIQAGMAFRIALTAEQQRGFNRIVVLGLKTGLSAKDDASTPPQHGQSRRSTSISTSYRGR